MLFEWRTNKKNFLLDASEGELTTKSDLVFLFSHTALRHRYVIPAGTGVYGEYRKARAKMAREAVRFKTKCGYHAHCVYMLALKEAGLNPTLFDKIYYHIRKFLAEH